MVESLQDLQQKLNGKLNLLYGNLLEILSDIQETSHNEITDIYVNEDYTPYSIKRDNDLKAWCNQNSINFQTIYVLLLDRYYLFNGSIPRHGLKVCKCLLR